MVDSRLNEFGKQLISGAPVLWEYFMEIQATMWQQNLDLLGLK